MKSSLCGKPLFTFILQTAPCVANADLLSLQQRKRVGLRTCSLRTMTWIYLMWVKVFCSWERIRECLSAGTCRWCFARHGWRLYLIDRIMDSLKSDFLQWTKIKQDREAGCRKEILWPIEVVTSHGFGCFRVLFCLPFPCQTNLKQGLDSEVWLYELSSCTWRCKCAFLIGETWKRWLEQSDTVIISRTHWHGLFFLYNTLNSDEILLSLRQSVETPRKRTDWEPPCTCMTSMELILPQHSWDWMPCRLLLTFARSPMH